TDPRELSPALASFLKRKSEEIGGRTAQGPLHVFGGTIPGRGGPKGGAGASAEEMGNLESQIRAQQAKEAGPSITIDDLKKIGTELRENMPANATPFDKKI